MSNYSLLISLIWNLNTHSITIWKNPPSLFCLFHALSPRIVPQRIRVRIHWIMSVRIQKRSLKNYISLDKSSEYKWMKIEMRTDSKRELKEKNESWECQRSSPKQGKWWIKIQKWKDKSMNLWKISRKLLRNTYSVKQTFPAVELHHIAGALVSLARRNVCLHVMSYSELYKSQFVQIQHNHNFWYECSKYMYFPWVYVYFGEN